ncbi:MAG TPA: hypothetical protein VIL20_24620, partial [Sandaracinaceae bacterium]
MRRRRVTGRGHDGPGESGARRVAFVLAVGPLVGVLAVAPGGIAAGRLAVVALVVAPGGLAGVLD